MRTLEQIEKELAELSKAPGMLADQVKAINAMMQGDEAIQKQPGENVWLLRQYAGMMQTLISLPSRVDEKQLVPISAELIQQLMFCSTALERLDFPFADMIQSLSEGLKDSFIKIIELNIEKDEILNSKPDGHTIH